MANTTFSSGQTLTAAQCNAFPFGVMVSASSSANYTLTTSVVIATGMTATFTAIANRLYKITYFEPQANTSTVLGSFVVTQIRRTNAAGTLLNQAIMQTPAAATINGSPTVLHVGTFSAGSVTVVGCAQTSSTTGTPLLTRSDTVPARFLVEDIGPS